MNIQLTNKRILITGGAGFIGSNLSEVLLEKGNTVICLDKFEHTKLRTFGCERIMRLSQ